MLFQQLSNTVTILTFPQVEETTLFLKATKLEFTTILKYLLQVPNLDPNLGVVISSSYFVKILQKLNFVC